MIDLIRRFEKRNEVARPKSTDNQGNLRLSQQEATRTQLQSLVSQWKSLSPQEAHSFARRIMESSDFQLYPNSLRDQFKQGIDQVLLHELNS